MLDSVKKEVENIIKKYAYTFKVEEFKTKANFYIIMTKPNLVSTLSEDFIREFQHEVDCYWQEICENANLSECFIGEFQDKVDWDYVFGYQVLSEDFIRQFKDKEGFDNIWTSQVLSESFIRDFQDEVDWVLISKYQSLSESFIKEFKDKVDWHYISENQILSESFIREFHDKVRWDYLIKHQRLSENFIREFKDTLGWSNWYDISSSQNLSEHFLEEFKDKISLIQYKRSHITMTREEKIEEIKKYAEKYNLEFDGEYLYAYRFHDPWGRGVYNSTIRYKKGEYYRDWHCDMDRNIKNSFGLGVWPEGNTKVKVSVEDWGCWVDGDSGKCRVWGFTVL